MGEVEINYNTQQLHVNSNLIFYGFAANAALSYVIANDIANHWNAVQGLAKIKNILFRVYFNIIGIWAEELTPETVFANTDPKNNYFRIEEYAVGNISFVDDIGCNTGYFKLDNLLDNSTTAAHEYGHTLGLVHPEILDIRGKGTPGIMYPRGTIVDAAFQYSPVAAPNAPGGTINPFTRKVFQKDIDDLMLHRLSYNKNNRAVIGNFTSIWHNCHLP